MYTSSCHGAADSIIFFFPNKPLRSNLKSPLLSTILSQIRVFFFTKSIQSSSESNQRSHLTRLSRPYTFNSRVKNMGALMSKFWFMLFPAKEYKIVVVGLDNAGKTTTLYKLHLGEVVTTHPTVGSNVEELVYKNIRFEVWDLGGQDRLRTSWATYYRGTHAVIVVIDSTDRVRIGIMKDELFRLLPHDDLQNSVVLVFANKQDLKDAMTPAEITDALSLHSIKNHDWHIQACCALTGDGLYDGLGWIAQHVTGKAPS